MSRPKTLQDAGVKLRTEHTITRFRQHLEKLNQEIPGQYDPECSDPLMTLMLISADKSVKPKERLDAARALSEYLYSQLKPTAPLIDARRVTIGNRTAGSVEVEAIEDTPQIGMETTEFEPARFSPSRRSVGNPDAVDMEALIDEVEREQS